MTRILLADDHTLFRAGVKQMLLAIAGLDVCGEAASQSETLALIASVSADILVCDLSMPGVTGMSLIEAARQLRPGMPILVLSMHDEPTTVRRALQAGATAYLTKEASPDMLREAMIKAAKGERFITPELAHRLAFATIAPETTRHDTLSAREREVYRLIAQGVALAQIGEQLHLSPKTITTHKTHLMEKLGVDNNAELIRYALEHRLFDS